MRPSIPDITSQGKKEEEDSLALKIVLCIDTTTKKLNKKTWGTLITAARNNNDNTRINRTAIIRKQKWEEKQLYGYFKLQIREISLEKIWTWLRKKTLKDKLNLFK